MDKNLIVNILKQEVVPALGCTEPVAVALCAAAAYQTVKGDIKKIDVKVSPNIYKNGMSVGIPGIDNVGLNFAAALGAVGGNPQLKLQVLNDVKDEHKTACLKLIEERKVVVSVEENMGNFFIGCNVETSSGVGVCHIKNSHSNIVYLAADNKVIFENNETAVTSTTALSPKLKEYNLMDALNTIKEMDYEELLFMLDGAKMNMEIAKVGLEHNFGMRIGKNIKNLIEKGILADDLYHNVVMMTAAGSDARMSGHFMPVMSSAGSGNHGLTAIIPVAVVAQKLNKKDEELAKALAISHITTIYIKQYTGRLSAICGCGVAAATGAAVAICYLLGGWEKEFKNTISNMVGDVTGMICDGAKAGCAIKLSTAAGAALKAALLAMNGSFVPFDNGVVGMTMDDTIKNLGRVCAEGMVQTDKVILNIMVEKNIVNIEC
ncbi:serine dehydratase subunit alpha family protein [Fervidicella metallireducens]|uniref:L-cysteine desulfidase family protein n=1 Tax=Fervidicella metallireducens TaxID=655338 RepID=UPI000685C282|nr:L-serine ammonia-lyase, iron-sulfur-dependent, subunit alpha [Fervidicella metallireducens]